MAVTTGLQQRAAGSARAAVVSVLPRVDTDTVAADIAGVASPVAGAAVVGIGRETRRIDARFAAANPTRRTRLAFAGDANLAGAARVTARAAVEIIRLENAAVVADALAADRVRAAAIGVAVAAMMRVALEIGAFAVAAGPLDTRPARAEVVAGAAVVRIARKIGAGTVAAGRHVAGTEAAELRLVGADALAPVARTATVETTPEAAGAAVRAGRFALAGEGIAGFADQVASPAHAILAKLARAVTGPALLRHRIADFAVPGAGRLAGALAARETAAAGVLAPFGRRIVRRARRWALARAPALRGIAVLILGTEIAAALARRIVAPAIPRAARRASHVGETDFVLGACSGAIAGLRDGGRRSPDQRRRGGRRKSTDDLAPTSTRRQHACEPVDPRIVHLSSPPGARWAEHTATPRARATLVRLPASRMITSPYDARRPPFASRKLP